MVADLDLCSYLEKGRENVKSFVQRTDHSGIFLEQKHTKKLKISSIFNHSEELAIHKGTPINETNAQVETHPLTVEMKIRKYSK